MMSAYSAASHGHGHPRILAALEAQARRLAVPSRAYYNDRLGPFLEEICKLTGLDAALPMNTGAEAVETAIKAARRWGYRVKGVAATAPRSSSPTATSTAAPPPSSRFRPSPTIARASGRSRPASARCRSATSPPSSGRSRPTRWRCWSSRSRARPHHRAAGGLLGLRRICDAHNVLLILDEVQSGLGRTGAWFAFQHERIRPDGLVWARRWAAACCRSRLSSPAASSWTCSPGSHGSTFGGNPLAAAVGLEALHVIRDGAGGEEPRARRPHARAFARDREPGAQGRARTRPVGRRRDRSGGRQCARRLRAPARRRACCRRKPTARWFAWRRRW